VRAIAFATVIAAAFGCSVETTEPVSALSQAQSSGPCVFGPGSGAGTPRPKEFSIKLPNGVSSRDIALATTGGEIDLRENSRVFGSAQGFAALSSVESTNRMRLGQSAEVGSVYSELEGVRLENAAHVHGVLKTASTVDRGAQSIVDGAVSERANLRPLEVASWVVVFPASDRGSCSFSGEAVTLEPGAYGQISVGSGARLKLGAGRYYFRTLSIGRNAVLEADDTAGAVSLYVEESFDFEGAVQTVRPDALGVVVGVAGTSADVDGAFRGAIVAPLVELRLDSDTELRGSFFAKKIRVQPGTVIRHVPFSPDSQCVPDPNACSVLCRCSTGGVCRIDGECNEGLACVGATTTTPGVCQPANVDDGNPCTIDEFDPATGPVHRPHPLGTSCSDGNACDGDETCDGAGVCVEGTPPDLDDQNPCTTDACTPGTGVTHEPVGDGTPCGDDNECNGDERCDAAGHCMPGEPLDVDDGNPCTADVCDASAGVGHEPLPVGTSCADLDVCDGAEACDGAGSCAPGTPLLIDDSNACTTDSCDPVSGPRHVPVPSGNSCADADRCNGDETCDGAGHCVGGGPPSADDGNPCTEDSCDPATGPQHTPSPLGTRCDNDNVCDGVSTCDGNGACVAGPVPSPDDGNPCTTDTCDPVLGVRHTPVTQGTSCEDGDLCNGTERCSADAQCEPGTVPDLDDDNPCTIDTCDPATGVDHDPAPLGTSCPNDDLCDGGETCDGAGSCTPGTPPALDDGNLCTTDSCHPTLGAQHDPRTPGSSCSDGDACDGEELCDASATCQPGQAPEVDDQNACTIDHCDPVSGVIHEPSPVGTTCSDGQACNGMEICDGVGVCQAGDGLDLLVIASPEPGFLTRDATVVISGSSEASAEVVVNVEPGGATVTLPGGAGPQPFSLPVPLVEGGNHFTVRALDQNGCSASEELDVRRDSTPPTVTLQAPDSLSVAEPGQAVVSVSDASQIVDVRFTVSLAGAVVASQGASGAPPYVFDFGVPSGAVAGDTLVIDVQVFDQFANVGEASKAVVVRADAMVIGRVLSDATGLPVSGASVRLGEQTVSARSDGRYSLPASDSEVVVRAWRAGFTSVERAAPVEFGTGTAVFDARLTPLAAPLLVSGDDLSLGAELARWDGNPVNATLGVPAAAFDGPVAIHFTTLSPQGLSALLPPGWSPVAGFELRVAADDPNQPETDPDTAFPALDEPLTLAVSGLPETPLALVAHDRQAHRWRAVGTLTASSGQASTELAGLGAFAVVISDSSGTPSIPSPGAPLTGLDAVAFPIGATALGGGVPDSLPAGGGVAQGRVVVPASSSLPSGTVITAAVSEAYSLGAGLTASTETRLQDLVLYRAQVPALPGVDPGLANLLGAYFSITPAVTFDTGELASGKIHIGLLGGREAHRGKIGGRAGVTVEHAGATLEIFSGSLEADTVMDIERIDVSDFAFRSTELIPLAQVAVDTFGTTLTHGAELRISGLPLAVEETPLLAKLERVDDIAYPFVVAVGTYDGAAWTFGDGDGFAGIVKDGSYVVYRATLPLGFVAGTTSAAGAPVQAVVGVEALPFVARSGLDGIYKIPARPGNAALSAHVPGTNLAASESVTVAGGQTSPLDLILEGEVTTATVTPADGSVGVPRTTQIELTTSLALDPETVTEDNIRLFAGDPADAALVAVRLQLSASGKSLAVIPELRLDAATDYTLRASGLLDTLGGVVVVHDTTFRTFVEVPPTVDTDPIDISIPEGGGNAIVSVPPGMLAPGTTIIITNEGNGHVTSCTVGNNGGVDCEIPATIDDTLIISVTDPDGNTTTIERGQYRLPDGRTAVGPAGGVVTGPGGVELRIPEGALTQGTKFSITAFGPDLFNERPGLVGAVFGIGIEVKVEGQTDFEREIDLVFPKPANAADDSFYYVHRRIEPDVEMGTGVTFEVIDHAFLEIENGESKVVTASCPFPGVRGIYDAFVQLHNPLRQLAAVSRFLLSSAPPEAPNISRATLVSGRVARTVWDPASVHPRFEGLERAQVALADENGCAVVSDNSEVALAQKDGRFSLWAPFGASPRLIAVDPSVAISPSVCCGTTSASQVTCITPVERAPSHPCGGEEHYRQYLEGNFTLPALAPPPPPPQIRLSAQVVVPDENGVPQLHPVEGIVSQDHELRLTAVASSNVAFRGIDVEFQDSESVLNVQGGADWTASYLPSVAGNYVFRATGMLGSDLISAALDVRVVGPSGNVTKDPCDRARVLTEKTQPIEGATDVPLNTAPQVVFTEPVTNVRLNVALIELSPVDEEVRRLRAGSGLRLTGVRSSGETVRLDSAQTDSVAIVSLIVEPTSELRFATRYELALEGRYEGTDLNTAVPTGILDLDEAGECSRPSPRNRATKPLIAYSSRFTTFQPQALTSPTSSYSSPRVAVVGNRAFLAQNELSQSRLHAYDVSDPANPDELDGAQQVARGRPVALDAEGDGVGATTVLLGTGPSTFPRPSNLLVYDVSSGGASNWVGAVTLSVTPAQGLIHRVIASGGVGYAITSLQGIQVVDLDFARSQFQQVLTSRGKSHIEQQLITDGVGFGEQAVIGTIPVSKADGRPAFLADLAIAQLEVGSTSSRVPVAVVTGEIALGLYDALNSTQLFKGGIVDGDGDPVAPLVTFRGRAIDLLERNGKTFAVLAGDISTGSTLLVVDVTRPTAPFLVSQTPLGASPISIAVDDRRAFIGSRYAASALDDNFIRVFYLDDLASPVEAGIIHGIAGEVALTQAETIVTTMPSLVEATTPFGGINTASLVAKAGDSCDLDGDLDGIYDCVDGYQNTWTVGQFGFRSQRDLFSRNFSSARLSDPGLETAGIIFDSETERAFADAPSPSQSERTGSVDSVVVHTCGWFNGCVNYLRNAATKVSIHYVVGRSGRVLNLVQPEKKANHAPYYNSRSIGIELEGCFPFGHPEGSAPCDFPPAQTAATASLIAHLYRSYPDLQGRQLEFPPDEAQPSTGTASCDCSEQAPKYDRVNTPGVLTHRQLQPVCAQYGTTCAVAKDDPKVPQLVNGEQHGLDWEVFSGQVSQAFQGLPDRTFVTVRGQPGSSDLQVSGSGGSSEALVLAFCDEIETDAPTSRLRPPNGLAVRDGDEFTLRCKNGPAALDTGHADCPGPSPCEVP
jgi:hypothetical protein